MAELRTSAAPFAADKLRLLFVNTPTTAPLGADTWVHAQIMKHLDRSVHEVHAACAPGTLDVPTPTLRLLRVISDIDVRLVDFGPEMSGRSFSGKLRALLETRRALVSLARLAILIRRQRVQIIHTSDRPRDALACVLLARLTGAKCIIHVHVGYGEWMSPLLKWSLKRADALIAVSDFVARTLRSNGHDPLRIRVVLNAIDPNDWHPGAGREEARHALGLPSQAPVLLTVCRLFPSKGAGDLIRALPEIRREYPDVRLLIVGGEMAVGFRRHLEALAHSLGLAENVVFTGRRDDVERLMAAADIYAMPSVGEPFGLVFLEAMAMKLPVVALNSGGAPEVVEHGVTSLLSEPGDGARLVEHLLTLLRDAVLRDDMGARGRQRVESYFTSPRMARDTESVYKWLTAESGRGERRL